MKPLPIALALFILPATGRAAEIDFNRDVRPILSDKCFACHGPDEKHRKKKLRLDVEEAVLHIDLRYMNEEGEHNPTVRNIFLDHVSSQKSEHPIFLLGIEAAPMRNIVVSNCTFAGADKPSVLEHVAELTLHNVTQPLDD